MDIKDLPDASHLLEYHEDCKYCDDLDGDLLANGITSRRLKLKMPKLFGSIGNGN